jgi:hypothetical protein
MGIAANSLRCNAYRPVRSRNAFHVLIEIPGDKIMEVFLKIA